MHSGRASDYGDAHTAVYDRIYGDRFAPESAVATLAEAAGPQGRLLELGIGTGRLAIPLLSRGVHVEGIEASAAMIDRLRLQPGGKAFTVFQVDLADFELTHDTFDVAVCAVSTLFILPGRAAQESFFASAARHLRLGGLLFIEAFRPDPHRFDRDGNRVESRSDPAGGTHIVRSHHDEGRRCIQVTHELSNDSGLASFSVTLHYASVEELDEMAALAGLTLKDRWHDWSRTPLNSTSTDPISLYELV